MKTTPSITVLLLCLTTLLVGCGTSAKHSKARLPDSDTLPSMVTEIEQTHQAAKWRSNGAVQMDMLVEFGGQKMVDGVVTFSTDGGRARIVNNNGATVVFDGSRAWMTGGQLPNARFQILTWPYFACVPYKLRDGGTTVTQVPEQMVAAGQAPRPAIKLTFAPGTGDAPDDWYILIPQNGRLTAMSYIVTYGKPSGAPESRSAILYSDFQETDGVPIARHWTFYHWNPTLGVTGEPKGQVRIRSVKFVPVTPDLFAKPVSATEAALPNK